LLKRAAKLLLAEADVGTLSRQIELALFFDAKLDAVAMQPRARLRRKS